jgi:hypothetical protein
LLSKALGVRTIKGQFDSQLNRLKKTKSLTKLDARYRIQKKIYDEMGRMGLQSSANVAKMYWESKKKVYGIENELHLVEQVQDCMRVLFKTSQNKSISHKDILDLFDVDQDKTKLQGENGGENPLAGHIP